MNTFLYEDLKPKQQTILDGFLRARLTKREATLSYDRCKDAVIDNIGCDATVIFDGNFSVQITTAIKDTIEWRTAFVELARIMAADEVEQKAATAKATNSVTATAIRVNEPKPPSNRKKVSA